MWYFGNVLYEIWYFGNVLCTLICTLIFRQCSVYIEGQKYDISAMNCVYFRPEIWYFGNVPPTLYVFRTRNMIFRQCIVYIFQASMAYISDQTNDISGSRYRESGMATRDGTQKRGANVNTAVPRLRRGTAVFTFAPSFVFRPEMATPDSISYIPTHFIHKLRYSWAKHLAAVATWRPPFWLSRATLTTAWKHWPHWTGKRKHCRICADQPMTCLVTFWVRGTEHFSSVPLRSHLSLPGM